MSIEPGMAAIDARIQILGNTYSDAIRRVVGTV